MYVFIWFLMSGLFWLHFTKVEFCKNGAFFQIKNKYVHGYFVYMYVCETH